MYLGLKQLQQQLWCLLLFMRIGSSAGIAVTFLEHVRNHFQLSRLQADYSMAIAGLGA